MILLLVVALYVGIFGLITSSAGSGHNSAIFLLAACALSFVGILRWIVRDRA